jgi:hypothetical protein
MVTMVPATTISSPRDDRLVSLALSMIFSIGPNVGALCGALNAGPSMRRSWDGPELGQLLAVLVRSRLRRAAL